MPLLSLYEEFPDESGYTRLAQEELIEFIFIPSTTPGVAGGPTFAESFSEGVSSVLHSVVAVRLLPDGEIITKDAMVFYPEWYQRTHNYQLTDRREMTKLKPFEVYRARGTYFLNPIRNDHRLTIVELLETTPDPEMEAFAELLAQPVHLDTAIGRMSFDRNWSEFNGRALDDKISVSMEYDGAEPLTAKTNLKRKLTSARKFLAEVLSEEYLDAARDFAGHKLLKKANEWRDDVAESEGRPVPAPELSAADVSSRLTPTSIHIPPRGNVSVEFDDGYTFGGHPIEVTTKRTGEPVSASF